MSYSLNEVAAQAKKAARGAGYTWGMADEVAGATKWLCAHSLDGCGALAGLLGAIDGQVKAHAPELIDGRWQAKSPICPVSVGVALADRAGIGSSVELPEVLYPVLLLPFVAQIAKATKHPVTMNASGFSAVTDGTALSLSETGMPISSGVGLEQGGSIMQPQPFESRAFPTMQAWDTLSRFAHRTYAPATEESRRKGAGAGLSDND